MKDLTHGSIPRHLINMAIPMMLGMFVQTLYFLVDLYFVGKLGASALAGLSLAGNAMFFIFALTQVLNVGTATLISHAVGEKDKNKANHVFNQSMMIASITGLLVCLFGYLEAETYLNAVSSDQQTIQDGLAYLHWFIPCMALQFVMVAISAALRGTGIVKPTMIIQMLSILINIILSPILIAGWGTGYAMGISGAGLASSISVVCAVFMLCHYFIKSDKYIEFTPSLWRPHKPILKKMFGIGMPAGGEFFLMFTYMGATYWLIQSFGANAQAAFGLGSRIMQSLFLPAMAIAFAAPAIAGQNFGAKKFARVKETYKWSATMTASLMTILTIICLFEASFMLTPFTDTPAVLASAAIFLQIICFNFIPSGLIFTCSGMFQSLGNTWPSLISTASRLLLFIVPAVWLANRADFQLEHIWYLSVSTVIIQAVISTTLLNREFRRRLPI